MFIGLGGVATLALRGLRRRITEQGDESLGPTDVRLLAIDTDLSSLRAAEGAPHGEVLAPGELLHLPLRKPAEYRAASDELLSWLCRRWLYNIPRSLHTEGLRPLGRLAFIDHRMTIAARLRGVLSGTAPRVFVVASIDGGAGGGMLLDVAYAVRQQLDELHATTECLCGLMLHATLARSPANDLRKANAYATLTEMNHFMRGGAAYRSGPMEVLPAGDVSEPPFHDAYLVALGEDLTEADLDRAVQQVADYLYLNAAACANALDDFRSASRAKQGDDRVVRLRSFGLHAVRIEKQAIATREADRLCLRLTRQWLGENDSGALPATRIQPPDFSLDDLAQRIQAMANKALSGNVEAHFRSLVAIGAGRPALVLDDDPAGPFGEELRRIHAVVGVPHVLEVAQAGQATRLEATLREGTNRLAKAMSESLMGSMLALVDNPDGRLPAALAGASLYLEHLRDLRQAAEGMLRQDQADAATLWSKLQRGELPRQRSWLSRFSAASDDSEECLLDYCRLRLRGLVEKYLVALLQDLLSQIAALNDQFIKLRKSIQWLSTEFAAMIDGTTGPPPGSEHKLSPLDAEIRRFAEPDYLKAFDRSLADSLPNAGGGLLFLADQDPVRWQEFASQLHTVARNAVFESLAHVDAGYLFEKENPSSEQLKLAVGEALSKCSARLHSTGCIERQFIVLPQATSSGPIVQAVRATSPSATIVAQPGADLAFLGESYGIVLSEAAAAIIQDHNACAEAARRVLTRVDVSWTALELQVQPQA
ncbi:MAG TPA: tubulin-like doman-containing protein [Pirellulales bacterium]|nr:tubulin-like doman-containing protein [Pirellulales bacterium]